MISEQAVIPLLDHTWASSESYMYKSYSPQKKQRHQHQPGSLDDLQAYVAEKNARNAGILSNFIKPLSKICPLIGYNTALLFL